GQALESAAGTTCRELRERAMKAVHHALAVSATLLAIGQANAEDAAAPAAGDAEALAQQLATPIASLISGPLQSHCDRGLGPNRNGQQYKLNIQPLIPMDLNADWNLISRTIVPVVHQTDVIPGDTHQTGLGDTVQSLFFSPKAPTRNGWIWGAGPV